MSITYKKQIYANNASTTLATYLSTTDTTISVTDASKFPTSLSGGFFLITLDNGLGVEIVEVRGVSGNTFTQCIRGREGTSPKSFMAATKVENRVTAATLASFNRAEDVLTKVPLLKDLKAPELTNDNSYIVAEVDDSGSPITVVSALGKWGFLNYPSRVISQAADSTATNTSVAYTGGSLVPRYFANGMVIQFTTGNNRGLCRKVWAVTSTRLSVADSFPYVPAVGDTFEVYQSTSSTYKFLTINGGTTATLIDLGDEYDTANSFYVFPDGGIG